MNLKNKKILIPAFLATATAVGGGYYYANQSDDIENVKMTNVESASQTPIAVLPRKLTDDEKSITYMCVKMEDMANIQIDLTRLKNSYELTTGKTKEKINFKDDIDEYVKEIEKYRKKHPQASGKEIVSALSLQNIHTPSKLLDDAVIDMPEEYYLHNKNGTSLEPENPINSLVKLFYTMQDFIDFVNSATYPPAHPPTDENKNIYNYTVVIRDKKHLPLWSGRYVCTTYTSVQQTLVEIESYTIFRETLDKENEEALKANKKPIFDTKKERLYDVFAWKALPYLRKILDRSQSEYLEKSLRGWQHNGTVIYADARKDGSPLTITTQHYNNFNSPENWIIPVYNP